MVAGRKTARAANIHAGAIGSLGNWYESNRMMDRDLKSISAVIVTLNRPDCVRRCLTALQAQEPAVHQIIVVDGSPDDRTRAVVDSFPGVLFLKNNKGLGHTT